MKYSVPLNSNDSFVLFICKSCGFKENIPKDVLDFLDFIDGGDPFIPPRFDCQMCSGEMFPSYYFNLDGIVYKS